MESAQTLTSSSLFSSVATGILEVPKKVTVIRLRWLVVIVSSYLLLSSRETLLVPTWVHGLILFYILTNVGLYLVKGRLFDSSFFYSPLVIFDTLFVTVSLAISGQVESDFYLVYFLIIILCTIWQDFRGLVVVAILATFLYGYFLFKTAQVHEQSIYLRLPFLFVISLFYGYFAQAVRIEKERISRFRRYLSPQIAATILVSRDDDPFRSHRREITVVFLDLRGFTAFSDSAEPEEVMELLQSYHAEMGRLIFKFEGTLERFAGDGIMVFFNDPIPCEDHTERAVGMALEMRTSVEELRTGWLKKGYDLDLGVGLAAGFATLGNIGFEGRMDYGAVGNVTNLAARLCEEAKGGQILTNQKTLSKIEGCIEAEPLEELHLKGFGRPVAAFNIMKFRQ